ncbi:MAG: hypothetical protein ACKO7W_24025 [Elainella sp.]
MFPVQFLLSSLLACVWLGLFWFGFGSARAEAAVCRTTAQHQICIVEARRSAKNHWEYQALVRIDGVERAERYDCRLRVRTTADGEQVPFEAEGAGVVLCRILDRS